MNFGENLKKLRIERGITQKALGLSLGVTPVTIGNWERGVRQPSFELLVQLAGILMTSTDTLLGMPAPTGKTATDESVAALIKKYKALDAHGRKLVEAVCALEYERVKQKTAKERVPEKGGSQRASKNRYIPLYLSPPAAGFGVPLAGEDYEMLRVDDSVPEDADYAVHISGDSMEPYIQDGETVFVKETETLSDGDVGIFSVNGEMYCKQYYLDGERNLHLLSANPDRADVSVHISYDSGYTVRCCGKVLLGYKVPLPEYFCE